MLFFLLYSIFLPPTPGGLLRRTYQSSVPENQCTAQIQYSVAYIRIFLIRSYIHRLDFALEKIYPVF